MTNHNLTFQEKFEKTIDIFNNHKNIKNPYKTIAQKICEYSSYKDLEEYNKIFWKKSIFDINVFGFPVLPITFGLIIIFLIRIILFITMGEYLNNIWIYIGSMLILLIITSFLTKIIFLRPKFNKKLKDLIEDLILENDIYEIDYNALKEKDLNKDEIIEIDHKSSLKKLLMENKIAFYFDKISANLHTFFNVCWIMFFFNITSFSFNDNFKVKVTLILANIFFLIIFFPFALYQAMDDENKMKMLKYF